MTLSQNVRFVGNAPIDTDYDHPPGAGLARNLLDALQQRGIAASDFDNWRDVGWVINVNDNEHGIEIGFASTGDSEWLLQIAPRQSPGVLSRLMGTAPDRSDDLLSVARIVAEVLPAMGFSHFRWRADGPPRDGDPETPERPR